MMPEVTVPHTMKQVSRRNLHKQTHTNLLSRFQRYTISGTAHPCARAIWVVVDYAQSAEAPCERITQLPFLAVISSAMGACVGNSVQTIIILCRFDTRAPSEMANCSGMIVPVETCTGPRWTACYTNACAAVTVRSSLLGSPPLRSVYILPRGLVPRPPPTRSLFVLDSTASNSNCPALTRAVPSASLTRA